MSRVVSSRGLVAVVLAVVAAVGVVGPAAAAGPGGGDATGAGPEASVDAGVAERTGAVAVRNASERRYDARLRSGADFWLGQDLFFDGTAVVEGDTGGNVSNASAAERTFELRRVDGKEVGAFVSEFVVDRDGTTVLGPSNVTGRLVVIYRGKVIAVENGSGRVAGFIGSNAVSGSEWRLTEQNLTVTADDGDVARGGREDLTVASNRSAYSLEVGSGSLGAGALRALFGGRVVETHQRRGTVVVRGSQRETFALRVPADFPRGEHDLRFRVNDSLARAGVTLNVYPAGQTPTPDRQTTTARRTDSPTPSNGTSTPATATPTTTATASETPGQSVTPTATPTTGGATTGAGTTTTGPGFGPVAAVLALLSVALWSRRR